MAPKDNASKPEKSQAFIKEEVLVGIHNDVFPCTAEQFYNLLLIDDCSFTNEYRAVRKDTNLSMGQWHPADEYDGLVREITFRTICNSPMCPPDTAMTEYQHSILSPDKKKLVFETVQQAHDVPFGSYFEVHCRWCVETSGENSSILDVKVGAHFKKWCVMQSKIRSGSINEYKKEVEVMLDVARSYIKSQTAGGEINYSSSSPPVIQQGEMDFRQDTVFSHVVSWCKKITGAKRRKKIYPSLRPKTEYLFDLRDSVKEEMIKELMVGTKRTKECREWLIKVREFEANAKELLQFHEKISDNLRFSKKQPHADLMNVLDEITRLLESSPLQRATRTRSSSMIEGKSFGLAERTSNAYLRSKTEDPVQDLEAARSRAMGKEVEKGKEILLIKYGTKLLSSSRKAEGDQKPRNLTKKKGSFFSLPQVETKDGSTTTVGSMIDMEAPSSGNSGAFWSESSLITSSSLPSDGVDLKTKPEEVSSSQTNILPTAGQETELISFEEEEAEEETKPSQRPEISKTVLNEIEEISSSHETESETSLPAASQIPKSLKTVNPSVEPPIEVGAFISPQREIFSLDRLPVASWEEEILLPDEVGTKVPSQTDAKANVERTVLKILELLSNDTVRRIGVCGTGKVGKTTVLKAFIDHPQINDMFDLIIWVTVSKYWSIRKMQDEVLRQLSTDFKAESENREELLRYLEGRKFLLVLDDVWESIDLEAVGIPNPSSENGSAIILATRNLEVCNNMRFINMIEVGTLSNEEAWKLFCEQVGRVVNIPGILPFARVIAERCGGLPLLVIVTGRALSGEEDVFAWEQAFKQFSGPCGDLRSRNDIIQLLKFSFDRLQVHDIQTCFLHCALFPEDQEVNISEFVTYCIEEGLIAGNTADAYKRSHEIITVLTRAFLLETTSNSSIIMHDMIRDLALAILLQEKDSQFLLRAYSKPVSRENHSSLVLRESPENNRLFIPDGCQFILRGGSRLTQPPSVEEWGKSSMIFLMDNNLSALPESPSCPGLLTLFLQRNFRLRVIAVSFFDCMPCLKVLNLSNTRIKSLPGTISKLVSLETLILRHCERLSMLPSDIGSLKLLQVLDLRGTEINLLPDEIGELSSLTYFDICFYGSINRREHLKLPQGLISSGIISRLCALQSLGIRVCPGDERWDKCVKSIIYEVSKLTGLTSLSFYFPEVELLELFLQKSAAWIDQCLTEYNFVVGHDIKRIVSRVPQYVELDYDRTSQRLRFVNGEKIPDAIALSGLCSSFPSLKPNNKIGAELSSFRKDSLAVSSRSNSSFKHFVAREVSADLSKTNDVAGLKKAKQGGLEKDPKALWRRYVDWLYQHKELGLYLDVSRIGFSDEFVSEMEPRFQAAFKAMQELERGAVANPDEGRMVGHYWLRNAKLAPNPFLQVQIDKTLAAICDFADSVISGKIKPPSSPEGRFTQILSVGIGGSALGPQFVAEALAPDNPPLKIRFIDNTDPAGIDHQIAQLGPELASTLVIVISKSGGTPETRNGLLEVQKAFREAGLDFAKQGVAITQENSLLDNTARIEGWVARFPMFDWVGGRTSEMSAVGLLPAALQGVDIREMLVGASMMDEATRSTVLRKNPAALLALCWYWATDGIGSKDMVVLPYKDSLLLFSRYLQQLVMESLGKEFDLDGNRVNQGISVYGNKGSTDQHAYIQQLREGVHNFFVTFIEVLRDRPPGHDWELEPGVTCGDYLFGMLQGTRSALYANNRESITVTVQEVTPRSVGALIALYERAVGIYASLVNINAYHQPGVEAGKKAAGEVLALQKRVLAVLNEASCEDPAESLTLQEIADRCHAPDDIEMIYKIIEHMAANDRALIAEGDCGSPYSLKVFLGECNVDELYA